MTIEDTCRPYYCLECDSNCEGNPSNCLKINVRIQHEQSFSTVTRSDGLVIRVNECYLIRNHSSDIFAVERLWFDKRQRAFATGVFYLKSEQIQSDSQRKFYPNEVFRLTSTNESISIDDILRPCYVLDPTTFCKGKPIAEYASRLIDKELFICEYRLEKNAKNFTRLNNKSKQMPTINTKSYCFDNYVEKLTVKRDYQVCFFDNKTKTVIIFCLKPYEKEVQQHCQHDNRLRLLLNSTKLTNRQIKDKMTRLNGCLENIYCHFHDQSEISHPTKTTFEQIFGSSQPNSPDKIRKKRRTISVSSDDDIIELLVDQDCQSPAKKRSTTKQKIISPRKRDDLYC